MRPAFLVSGNAIPESAPTVIACDIHIEFQEGAQQSGMSIAVDPRPQNATPEERRVWVFMGIALKCALDRVKAQMANLSQTSDELETGLESRWLMEKRMKALGAGQRLTASFAISWHPAGGLLYTLIRVPDQTLHTLENAAWQTFKTALDFATDFFDSDGFGQSYEEDQRNLREQLEEKLAALPIFENPK